MVKQIVLDTLFEGGLSWPVTGGSMANSVRALLDLQGIDLEIRAKRIRLDEIEVELADEEPLQAARAEVDVAQAHFKEIARAQREAEAEAAEVGAKFAEVGKKLYGGTIRNPRELEDLQADADQLRARHRKHEDAVIDIMAETEAAEADLSQKKQALAELEATRQARVILLGKERDDLLATLVVLDRERAAMASGIEKESLRLYEVLKGPKNGQVVALVQQGRCQGCRIALPLSELQRARAGRELIQCSHCERILLVT